LKVDANLLRRSAKVIQWRWAEMTHPENGTGIGNAMGKAIIHAAGVRAFLELAGLKCPTKIRFWDNRK
jgi:hypothetical protein